MHRRDDHLGRHRVLLVIVNDLHVLRPGVGPGEADPPLLIDPDAVRPGTVPVSFSSRFPGGMNRSARFSAAPGMASLRHAARCTGPSILRDRCRCQMVSVFLSRKDRSTQLVNNAIRY
jgi:hypothetical protein